jgi:hypothetical protein
MTFVRTLKELWRRRILVAVAALLAALVAIVVAFQVTLSPASVKERTESSAVASIGILVDSARSPLADTRRDVTGLSARAGVLARVMAGGNVVNLIAREAGVPPEQIAVSGPVPVPGDGAGGGEAAEALPYGISFGQSGELPVIAVETRAPSLDQALALANASPDAIRRVVREVQIQQRTPATKRVQFRELGAAQGDVVEESSGARLALAVFLVVFALLLLAIVGWPRLVAAWRSADAEVVPLPEPAPTLVHLAPGRPDDPEVGDSGEKVGQRGEHA